MIISGLAPASGLIATKAEDTENHGVKVNNSN